MAVQCIKAWFNNVMLSSVDFSIVQGVAAGSGTMTFQQPNYVIPNIGELRLFDGERTLYLQKVYAVNPRVEQTADGGAVLAVSIYDRRYTWEWGFVVGTWNKQTYKGVPTKERTLMALILDCLTAVGETNPILIDIPVVYPEVNWEYKNPGSALQELLGKFGLTIGINTAQDGRIVVAPASYDQTFPPVPCISSSVSVSNNVLPSKVRLVGSRVIVQREFSLVPVGADTDGSIKHIDDLSFAPVSWGKEIIASFANLDTEEKRDLAEKCVFKWFTPDISEEVGNTVYPLLNVITDTTTEEGSVVRDKPYVKGTGVKWDGVSFKDVASQKITTGYQIDKKVGTVKFNDPQVVVVGGASGPVAAEFQAAELTLVAAYERKEGDENDFGYWERVIPGGTELPVIYNENSLIPYTYIESALGEFDNRADLEDYANGALDRLVEQHTVRYPEVKKYPGVWNVGAFGTVMQVVYSLGEGGAITEIQKGVEIPRGSLDNYEERLYKGAVRHDLLTQIKDRSVRDKKAVELGTFGSQPRNADENNKKSRVAIYGDSGGNTIIVKNNSGEVVPAASYAHLDSYDKTEQCWGIVQVTNEDYSRVVSVPEEIPTGKKGIAISNGLRVFKIDSEYTPEVGQTVAAKTASWEVESNDSGKDIVVDIDGDYVVTKSQGGGGASTSNVRTAEIQSVSGKYYTCKLFSEGFEEYEEGTIDVYPLLAGFPDYILTPDSSNVVPVWDTGDICIVCSTVKEGVVNWTFLSPIVYVGEEDERSISWYEDSKRIMAQFRG
jgi:hypothetical protein